MAGFFPPKMKRKDLEDVYDEFSEFSLSSPARKIRRLDAELPPIMEEEDPSFTSFEQQVPQVQVASMVPEVRLEMVDFEPPQSFNEERALVLYKPVNKPMVLSPILPSVSFSVNSDVMNSLKNNQSMWQGNPEDKQTAGNNSLAVVPWVPAQLPVAVDASESKVVHVKEPMDAEAEEPSAESASMEIEEAGINTAVGGGLHKWPQQQQHCMIPQAPQNASTPIMWSWR